MQPVNEFVLAIDTSVTVTFLTGFVADMMHRHARCKQDLGQQRKREHYADR